MSDSITIARPYAKAIFLLAKSSLKYKEWSNKLEFLSNIVSFYEVRFLIGNPIIDFNRKSDFIISLGNKVLGSQGENLVKLLALNGKLLYIPEIYELYEDYRNHEEGILRVSVTSASILEKSEQKNLSIVLSSKLNKKIIIKYSVDTRLLGGLLIKMKGKTIDGSLHGYLNNFKDFLIAS